MVQPFESSISSETWRRMARKAASEGLHAYRLNGDKRSWAVTSHSMDEVAYEVTILDGDLLCTCRGSMFLPYCKHRALVLEHLKLLDSEAEDRPIVPERVLEVLAAS
jgi:hypothetical protein